MFIDILVPMFLGFIIVVIGCPITIPFLRKLKFGQNVRDDGPESHLKKAGTPTMGGVVMLISIFFASSLYLSSHRDILPILFVTIGFGIIGFMDDFIKITKKRSLGLRAYQKLGLQLLITGIYIIYITNYTNIGTEIILPFTNNMYFDVGILFIPLIFAVILGTVNGVNLTDGLDGLAAFVTLSIAVFFTTISVIMETNITPITSIVVGTLVGFLIFNIHPAKVFMGDTGSLALGGFVATTAISMKMPLIILIVGMIYLVECISVILQVSYYKITKKRVFKMAPIHHHYELSGWKETKVVKIFTGITVVLCIIGIFSISKFI